LLDYQDRWDDLERSQNPFATVVMAHLKNQATKHRARARKDWKLYLIRRLYDKGYSRSEIINLFRFVDWAMLLSEKQKQAFWAELRDYEKQRKMPYITSVEEIGFNRGRQEGRQEGRRSLILLLLTEKFGTLSDETTNRIAALSLDQLQALAIALLHFNAIAQLSQWLDATEQSSQQGSRNA
jgi:predicted transposase YdaD